MDHISIIYSSAIGHLGWFHFQGVMNEAAMNLDVQMYLKRK